MIDHINASYDAINVIVSWSPPANVESAALTSYRITLFDTKKIQPNISHILNLTATTSQQNTSYTALLTSQEAQAHYSVSIIAENKCDKTSEEAIDVCSTSSDSSNIKVGMAMMLTCILITIN